VCACVWCVCVCVWCVFGMCVCVCVCVWYVFGVYVCVCGVWCVCVWSVFGVCVWCVCGVCVWCVCVCVCYKTSNFEIYTCVLYNCMCFILSIIKRVMIHCFIPLTSVQSAIARVRFEQRCDIENACWNWIRILHKSYSVRTLGKSVYSVSYKYCVQPFRRFDARGRKNMSNLSPYSASYFLSCIPKGNRSSVKPLWMFLKAIVRILLTDLLLHRNSYANNF